MCVAELIVAQRCHVEANISTSISSGHGSVPGGTQLLPGPMLTHHWDLVPFTRKQFRCKYSWHRSLKYIYKKENRGNYGEIFQWPLRSIEVKRSYIFLFSFLSLFLICSAIWTLFLHQANHISCCLLKKWTSSRSQNITTKAPLLNSLGPSDVGDLGQHWIRWWLVAWRHQAITWTNVDLLSGRSCGIHLTTLSQEDFKIPISKARLKTTF